MLPVSGTDYTLTASRGE